MAQSANEKIQDATIRHVLHVLRFGEGEADAILKILDDAQDELLAAIQVGLAKGTDTARLEALLEEVKARRAEVYEAVKVRMKQGLEGLAETEADWAEKMINGASPVELDLASVPLETLKALASSPISGVPVEGWLNNIQQSEAHALERAIRLGVVQGETVDQISRRIRGTKEADFNDGVLKTTRRNAQALARTAVNHVSNQAHDQVYQQNQDIIQCLRWTSTLDGRTSDVCKARDGLMVPVGDKKIPIGEKPLNPPGARPPAHFNCRSVLVPILDGLELAGDRPVVRDARVREDRERAFKQEAEDRGVSVKQVRQEWANKHVGKVPAKTTYDEWLRGQPREFQDEVLGRDRAEVFRSGLTLDKFVDASGKRLTLDELRAELAGDALAVAQPAIGLKAKGLLMVGVPEDEILDSIKTEFPDAKTSKASLASYKVELKKAGLMPDADTKSVTLGKKVAEVGVQSVVADFETALPLGLKQHVAGQWSQVVGDLEGHPGAYAHYKPGVGVLLSKAKLDAIPSSQAQQVMAHELGHLLHKAHDLKLDPLDVEHMQETVKYMSPELKKLYGYYLAHHDELTAEVYGQALSNTGLTSQGMSAQGFRALFKDQIQAAHEAIQAKFPAEVAPTPVEPGLPAPGLAKMPGKPTSVGSYAKALLQQGLPDDQVLAAVHAEFPSAKTGINSIKSYKSELKKAGMLPTKSAGPTVSPVVSADVPPAVQVQVTAAPVNLEAMKHHAFLNGKNGVDWLTTKKQLEAKWPNATFEQSMQAGHSFKLGLKESEGAAAAPTLEGQPAWVVSAAGKVQEWAADGQSWASVKEELGTFYASLTDAQWKLFEQAHAEVKAALAAAKAPAPAAKAQASVVQEKTFWAVIGQVPEGSKLGPSKKKAWMQEAALKLVNEGASSTQAVELLKKNVPATFQEHVPTTGTVSSWKVAWKKAGKLDESVKPGTIKLGQDQVMDAKATAQSSGTVAQPKLNLPKPKLADTKLGGHSQAGLSKIISSIKQGGDYDDAKAILQTHFGTLNEDGAKDLYELALWKVQTGQAEASPGVAASYNHAKATAQVTPKKFPVPLRPALSPADGRPPPPRFTDADRNVGLMNFLHEPPDHGAYLKINKRQKEAGLEELTLEEAWAISAYTGNHYTSFNRALRANRYAESVNLQASVEAAQHGLRKMPQYVGDTQRGLRLSKDELDKFLTVYREGNVVEDHAFVSTSPTRPWSGNVLMRLRVKSGVDVDFASRNRGEKEVLLPPGMKYKITKVEKNAAGGREYVIYMEEV